MTPLTRPVASTTMSQVRFAISPARSPAFADSRTITRFRNGYRVSPGGCFLYEEGRKVSSADHDMIAA
jgi:hypothetical protein